jgi:hypothetical protein
MEDILIGLSFKVQRAFETGVAWGASQFLAELFFSLAPGFSRVNRARRKWKRFQPFSAPAATKPLKPGFCIGIDIQNQISQVTVN